MTKRRAETWLTLGGCLVGALLSLCARASAGSPLDVIISEVAWAGTAASSSDEWIELENRCDTDVSLAGWTLRAEDGTPSVFLTGLILRGGFYLLERTDDATVSDIPADRIYTGALSDAGESLILRDPAGTVVDSVNADGGGWPAGDSKTRATLERVNPSRPDQDSNWRTNDGATRNGRDAKGAPLNGTPKERNSCTNPPTARLDWRVDRGAAWCTILFLDESTDRDGRTVAWAWDFGDGTDSLEKSPAHRYRAAGVYLVSLVVEDNDGLCDSARAAVEVVEARGDLDQSGTIDILDVRLLLQASLGILHLGATEEGIADVDGDGDIDEADAVALARRLIDG